MNIPKEFFKNLTYEDNPQEGDFAVALADLASAREGQGKAMLAKASFPKKAAASLGSDEESIIVESEPLLPQNENFLPESVGQLVVDVYQTANEIVVQSTIAGVENENLDISVSSDTITIKGRRIKEESVNAEDYFCQECYWGSFARTIILPAEIEPEKAKASLKNGILTIRLPKSKKNVVRKIKIASE